MENVMPGRQRKSLEDLKSDLKRIPDAEEAFIEHRSALKAAKFIRDMRTSSKLTQAQLAERLGVTQAVIGRLEAAVGHRGPTIDMLERVASACQMELSLGAAPTGDRKSESDTRHRSKIKIAYAS